MDVLATPWVNAQVAYLLLVWWATATVEDDKVATKVLDPTNYDEVVTTKESETVDAFSSKIIQARMKTAFTGERLNVMTQALCAEKGSLPQGLMVQNTYTKMCNGSRSIAIVVRNSTAYPQTLNKKFPVARVVTANLVPEPQIWPSMIDALDEAQDVQATKMTMEQRQVKLFEKLDLSSLGCWLPELADSAHSLLAEYHDIFSLESCKLGCTHLTKHVIKATDDALFREQFRQIPPCLVEEVHAHLWQMLNSGMICPNQSMWCNAVVLVWKKDGGLHFCIDFCHLNTTWKRIPTCC